MSEQIAFRMNLFDGFAEEYEKRHDEIFPELAQALKDAGVSDYSIWLDPQSNHLFGILTRADNHTLDSLPCLLYTSPSPRDLSTSRMPSSA